MERAPLSSSKAARFSKPKAPARSQSSAAGRDDARSHSSNSTHDRATRLPLFKAFLTLWAITVTVFLVIMLRANGGINSGPGAPGIDPAPQAHSLRALNTVSTDNVDTRTTAAEPVVAPVPSPPEPELPSLPPIPPIPPPPPMGVGPPPPGAFGPPVRQDTRAFLLAAAESALKQQLLARQRAVTADEAPNMGDGPGEVKLEDVVESLDMPSLLQLEQRWETEAEWHDQLLVRLKQLLHDKRQTAMDQIIKQLDVGNNEVPAEMLPPSPPPVQVSKSRIVILSEPDHLEWTELPLPTYESEFNQVTTEPTFKLAFDQPKSNHRRAHVRLGEWKMKFPRFIRLSHVLWWQAYDVVKSRRNNNRCATQLHPMLDNPKIQLGRLQFFPADLLLSKDIIKEAFKDDPVPTHEGSFFYCEETDTSGDVSFLQDVVVSHPSYATHPCSQSDNINTLFASAQRQQMLGVSTKTVGPLFWAYVTAAPFFQHWTQNVLPKIAIATLADESLYNSSRGTKWTASQELLPSRFPIVNKMYEHMGWAEPLDAGSAPIATDQLVYACKSPPLHPTLWRVGQQRLLQVKYVPVTQRKKIVYCGRSQVGNTENIGRRVINELAVLSLLSEWARSSEYEVVEFDHTKFSSVTELVEFWSDARALIGPHGGCMTNVVFIPANALVVEAFPLTYGVKRSTPGFGHMMYVQSMFLEHEYWMLPSFSNLLNGDFRMNLQELCEILVKSLGTPSGKTALCSNPIVHQADYIDYVTGSVPVKRSGAV